MTKAKPKVVPPVEFPVSAVTGMPTLEYWQRWKVREEIRSMYDWTGGPLRYLVELEGSTEVTSHPGWFRKPVTETRWDVLASVYASDKTPAAILVAAHRALQNHEQRIRERGLLGIYPPMKLVQS